MEYYLKKLRKYLDSIEGKYVFVGWFWRRLYYVPLLVSRRKKISGSANKIFAKYSVLGKLRITIKGDNNTIQIGKFSVLTDVAIEVRGNNNRLVIGSNCSIGPGGELILQGDTCSIEIGDKTTIGSAHIAVTEKNGKIKIGEDCMFAYDIDVRNGDSHSILNSITMERTNWAKDVEIGNHVWVATHVRILKGSRISNGSIVGTGSVVSRDFPDQNILVSGNPAKLVKSNCTWDRALR